MEKSDIELHELQTKNNRRTPHLASTKLPSELPEKMKRIQLLLLFIFSHCYSAPYIIENRGSNNIKIIFESKTEEFFKVLDPDAILIDKISNPSHTACSGQNTQIANLKGSEKLKQKTLVLPSHTRVCIFTRYAIEEELVSIRVKDKEKIISILHKFIFFRIWNDTLGRIYTYSGGEL